MTIARHTHSPREVGFFVEAALSPLSVSSVEWSDNGGVVEIYTTPDPLHTLRDIDNWTKFSKPGSSGSFDVPAGTRKIAIEATSHDANDPSSVTVISDGLTNMEQARLYGVDQLTVKRTPVPPFLTNLLHWYDLTDASTVFADTAGTILASNGSPIERINDKGTANDPLSKAGPNVPIYRTGRVNGLNAMETVVEGNEITGAGVTGVAAGTGVTVVVVWRQTVGSGLPASQSDLVRWDSGGANLFVGRDQVARFTAGNIGSSFLGPFPTVVEGQWEWQWLTDGKRFDLTRHKHAAATLDQNVARGAFAGIAASVFELGMQVGDIAECLVYDRDHDLTELTEITDYADLKYGSLPF